MKKKGITVGTAAYLPPPMTDLSELQREAEGFLTRRDASGKLDPDVTAFQALLEKHKDKIDACQDLAGVYIYYQTMLSKIPYRR